MRSSTSARPIASAAASRSTSARRKIWFERAARSGHLDAADDAWACCCSRTATSAGGLKWLKQAADQGEPRALLVYGTALYNGDGVTQDRVLGYAYVSRAAAQGLEPAKETLAQLDQLMPVADRQKGVALAARQGRQAAPPAKRQAGAASAQAKPPSPRPAASSRPLKPSPPARQAAAWRIQLGAFSQRGSRRSALPARFPARPHWPAAVPITSQSAR